MKALLMTLAAGAAGCVTPALAQVGYRGAYAPAGYGTGYAADYAADYAASYAAPAGGHYDFDGDHLDYDPSPVHGAGAGLGRPAFAPTHGTYGTPTGYGAVSGYDRFAAPYAYPAYPSHRRPMSCGTGYPGRSHASYNHPAGHFGLGW